MNHSSGAAVATVLEQALDLPGFTLLDSIARGASGIVYKAHDQANDRLVAVKVIQRGMFDDDHTMRRFLREVRVQGAMDHPNILPLYDAGFLETHPYIVTELAPNGSLRDRMRREAELPLPHVWRIGALVARGLEHAHSHGIVHRDLKPENILIDANGSPKIADFGLSWALPREHSLLTEAGTLLGTPSYIAPEAIEGEKAGPPADVYALGITLFEMLAGGPPFTGADLMELLYEKIHGEPPPLDILRPDAPAAGRMLVLACLERDPARRLTAASAATKLARLTR